MRRSSQGSARGGAAALEELQMERIQLILAWLTASIEDRREEGQTMIEYGLIVALISIVAILTLTTVGGNIQDVFNSIAGKLHS